MADLVEPLPAIPHRMARPLLMPPDGRRKMAKRQPCTRKMKAARSPLCEAGGKRRRAPAGADEARSAAHPQERQHSAAEGGTRDRVRPAGALYARRSRRPASGIVTYAELGITLPEWAETRENVLSAVVKVMSGSGRHAPRARPEGDALASRHFCSDSACDTALAEFQSPRGAIGSADVRRWFQAWKR
jgi:hypothetical protein